MTLFNLGIVGFWLAGVVGWVANIWQIMQLINDPITALLIIKCVGVFFAPIGAILGIFGMF